MMKRKTLLLVLSLILAVSLNSPAYAASEPQINSEAALLVDIQTNQILYAKNPDKPMYPASTTKILTALIVLEKADLSKVVTVSKRASETDGSAVWLKEGERITVEDLLYALLINSANDAAVALAEEVSGSVEEFVKLMNAKAASLGATHSHFTTPHGLPDEDHFTTARDLAVIAQAALKNPRFREIVATRTHTITREDPEALKLLINTNKLLWRYDGCEGVKTGYTSEAKQCLVALARRDGREVLSVVLKSEGQELWADSTRLLDYGFTAFKSAEIVQPDRVIAGVPVARGAEKLQLETATSFSYVVPVDGGLPPIQWKIEVNGGLEAPIAEGEKVGKLALYLGERQIGEVDLVAAADVPRQRSLWLLWLLLGIGTPLLAFEGLRRVARRRRWQSRRLRFSGRRPQLD
ncbi:D-alanyl-D-alanine carboxypeptidase family protein [Desulforudis sp. 1088]|uniref:D-alanyl-D-alanine carboxypeptidase family protein n=1 Tax=unclassified Candidatus Desulforudis TaxID=2635950 RepID=UPI003CE5A4DF